MTHLESAEAKLDNLEGTFFSCEDGEQVHHTDPYEALYAFCFDWIGFNDSNSGSIEEAIKKCFGEFGLRVEGFKPRKVSIEFVKDATSFVEDVLAERFMEEYSWSESKHPENDVKFKPETLKKLELLVQELYSECTVTVCDVVDSVDLTGDEVLAILKKYCPEEFESES